MGDHGLLGKTVMYEESSRVPMTIRAPMVGVEEQKRIGGNFSHIDLVPTLLELMGEHIPESLQGQSRVGVLRGDADLDDNDVFIEWSGADGHPPRSFGEAEINRSMGEPARTVVSADRWKLSLYARGPGELYDLNSDPHELENLFGRQEHQGRVRELTARVRQWQEETGDAAAIQG